MKTHIEFTRSKIVPPAPGFSPRETGAQVEFLGIVREMEDGKKIPGLFYEAHEPMARAVALAAIATESRRLAHLFEELRIKLCRPRNRMGSKSRRRNLGLAEH